MLTLLEREGFFEVPRWRDGRWWVGDFNRRAVYTVTPDGTEELVVAVDGEPGGLGWRPDGSLLVVSRDDHRLLVMDRPGTLDVVADLTPHCRGSLNDMVVDAAGRAWIGDTGLGPANAEPSTTTLKRVDPDGTVTVVADGMVLPNGSVITPDGATLIVGETFACRYTAFTIRPDGSLTDRRVWAQLAPAPPLGTAAQLVADATVTPDGCCLDAEGHIWSADPAGRRCVRIAPGGVVVDEIAAPEGASFYACMLGGDDGRTLLCCVGPTFSASSRRSSRGALMTTRVDVAHAGLP